jgi:MYXO-CTERM domain-containing protein
MHGGKAFGAASLIGIALSHADASAAPVVDGPTFTVFERPGVTRFPDVAYDDDDSVFLVVSGQQGVTARFVGADGVDGDAFEVTTDPMAYSPRVAAVGGAFVVCWLVESTHSVVCRTVTRATPPSLGSEQVLTADTVGHLESAPSLACSRAASECLVTWVDQPDLGIRGRRIGFDAAPIGEVVDIAVTDGIFEAFPTVACSESLGEYVVGHTREPDGGPMAIAAQRIAVGNGAPIGASTELYSSTGLNNYPEIAHDPGSEQYLAVSWLHEGNPDVAGRLVAADGTPIGERIAVAATRGFEGGDGIGLAFDAAAKSYLSVFQGPETPGEAQQVWAVPVSADGEPSAGFQVTSGAVAKGVYQPRVASNQAGRALVVTVVDYLRIDGQFVSFDVPDAGAGGGAGSGSSGAGAGAGGGSSGDSDADGSGADSSDDGGCGCRITPSSTPAWLAVAGLLAALGARRRSRFARA